VNLHHLRILQAVAAAGSFTGAARRLGITQPAVTIQVRDLEAAAGVRLVERRAGRAQPTEAGRALLGVGDRLSAVLDEAESVLAQARGAVTGTLRLSASGTAGGYLLPPLLTAFRRRHPEVRVRLDISNSRRVLEEVLAREADLGVLGAPDGAPPAALAGDPRLSARSFAREPLVLAVAPGHRWARRRSVGAAELAGEPLILREPGSATRRVLESRLEAAGVQPRVAMELGSNEALVHAVAAGLGVALVGARVVARDVAAGRLRRLRLRGPLPALRFFLIHHRARAGSPLLRAFLALARGPEAGPSGARPRPAGPRTLSP
jgi:molybdate transport repressor ModE-like protein